MKKNKLFAFLCCFAALVCTSFLASCDDDDDDKKFDPSAIYGSWKIYETRNTIYDKDGKVLDDDVESFANPKEYYNIVTFTDNTYQNDSWYDVGDEHGNSKFEIYATDIYDITYSENSIIFNSLKNRTIRKDFNREGSAVGKKANYSINGNTLTLTYEETENVEEITGIKGATKAIATYTFKKVNEKK